MARRKRKPKYFEKTKELKEAQGVVHAFQTAVEQGLPVTEVYEFLSYDLIDAVRYEDVCYLRCRLEQKGFDLSCTCQTCTYCILNSFLEEIVEDLL